MCTIARLPHDRIWCNAEALINCPKSVYLISLAQYPDDRSIYIFRIGQSFGNLNYRYRYHTKTKPYLPRLVKFCYFASQPDMDNNDNDIVCFRVIQEYIALAMIIYSCNTLKSIQYYISIALETV